MHIHQLDTRYKIYWFNFRFGSFGVTGVKTISLTDYMAWSRDPMHMHQLNTLYKIICVEIHPGSFVVTGVKRSFSFKLL